ncbi:MAG: hypothetical protein ACTSYR_04160 [Candidatus Odinarchaeia archaeon]
MQYQLSDVIVTLRKRLKDYTPSEYNWENDDLTDYIGDSLGDIERYIGTVYIVEVNDEKEFSRPLETKERNLLLLQTIITITESLKLSADRDNFSIAKGKLRIDNTKQSSDHGKTLDYLNRKLIKLLNENFIEGARVE